jgi:3-phenylpropionate/cinnamic acid dioxygenase small subunit
VLNTDDVLAIHALLADYGHVVDDHDWDRAHEVFAEDFVFERGDGRPDLHGIADIVATFKGRTMYAHVTTNTTLTEDDDGTVRAHSTFLGFPNAGQPVTGDYRDVVVRTPQGWRLARRHAEVRARKFFD